MTYVHEGVMPGQPIIHIALKPTSCLVLDRVSHGLQLQNFAYPFAKPHPFRDVVSKWLLVGS